MQSEVPVLAIMLAWNTYLEGHTLVDGHSPGSGRSAVTTWPGGQGRRDERPPSADNSNDEALLGDYRGRINFKLATEPLRHFVTLRSLTPFLEANLC